MRLKTKVANVVRRIKQSWGSAETKRKLWNKEFSEGRWDFIENSQGDVVYDFIRRHCRRGNILDLGCGTGSTGCELDASDYSKYTGVDISDNALQKATVRSQQAGRKTKNRFVQGDIVSYIPDEKFDLILSRESIYYVPPYKIAPLLRRYAESLTFQGVMIVRWHDARKGSKFLALLRPDFDVVETSANDADGPFVVAFKLHAHGVPTSPESRLSVAIDRPRNADGLPRETSASPDEDPPNERPGT